MTTPKKTLVNVSLRDVYTQFVGSKSPEMDPRNPAGLTWQMFPATSPAPDHLHHLKQPGLFTALRALNQRVFIDGCNGISVPSNAALEQMVAPLHHLKYEAEHQPLGTDKKSKVDIPTKYGLNGTVVRKYQVDAINWQQRTIVEVEAGTATANNAWRKDLDEAESTRECDYLVLVVRKLYVTGGTRNPDFATIYDSIDLHFQRGDVRLKGVLLVGY